MARRNGIKRKALLILLIFLFCSGCGQETGNSEYTAVAEYAEEEYVEEAVEPASAEAENAENLESAAEAANTDEISQTEEAAGKPAKVNMAELYPEAYATFRAMYEDNFYVDENGIFIMYWRESGGIIPIPWAVFPDTTDYTEYTGNALSYEITDFDNHGLSYSLINSSDETIGIQFPDLDLQIYLDGEWWDVFLPAISYSMSLVYLEPGENEYTASMYLLIDHYRLEGSGVSLTEEPYKLLPAGQYRLIWSLEPYDKSCLMVEFNITEADRAAAAAEAEDPSQIIELVYEETETAGQSDETIFLPYTAEELKEFLNELDMTELFPEASRTLKKLYSPNFYTYSRNSLYRELFVLDWRDEVDADDNPDSWPRSVLPDATEYQEYQGDDLTFTLKSFSNYNICYDIINSSDEIISPENSDPVLQILLDGQWWEIIRRQPDSDISAVEGNLFPGQNSYTESMLLLVQYSQLTGLDDALATDDVSYSVLPAGTYRLIFDLEPWDSSYFIAEFEITQTDIAAAEMASETDVEESDP